MSSSSTSSRFCCSSPSSSSSTNSSITSAGSRGGNNKDNKNDFAYYQHHHEEEDDDIASTSSSKCNKRDTRRNKYTNNTTTSSSSPLLHQHQQHSEHRHSQQRKEEDEEAAEEDEEKELSPPRPPYVKNKKNTPSSPAAAEKKNHHSYPSSTSTDALSNDISSSRNTNDDDMSKKRRVDVTNTVSGSPSIKKNTNSSLPTSSITAIATYSNSSLLDTSNKDDNSHVGYHGVLPQSLPPLQEKQKAPPPLDMQQQKHQEAPRQLENKEKKRKRHRDQVQKQNKDNEESVPTPSMGAISLQQLGPIEQVKASIATELGPDGTAVASIGNTLVSDPTTMATRPSVGIGEQRQGYYTVNFINNSLYYNNGFNAVPPNDPGQALNLRQNLYSSIEVGDAPWMNSISRNHSDTLQKTMLLPTTHPVVVNASQQPHHQHHAYQVTPAGYQLHPFARAPADSTTPSNLPTINATNQPAQQGSQRPMIHVHGAQEHVPSRLVPVGDILPTTFVGPHASNLNLNHLRHSQPTYSREYYLGAPNESLRALVDSQLRNLHAEQLLLMSLQQQQEQRVIPQHELNYPERQLFSAEDYARLISGQKASSNNNPNWIENNNQAQAQSYGQNQEMAQQMTNLFGGNGNNRNIQIEQMLAQPQTYYQTQQGPNHNSIGQTNQQVLAKSSTAFEGMLGLSSQQGNQNNYLGMFNQEQLHRSQQEIGLNSKHHDLSFMQNRIVDAGAIHYNDAQYSRSGASHYLHAESSPYVTNFNSHDLKISGNNQTDSNDPRVENQDARHSQSTTEKVIKSKKSSKSTDAPLNPLHAYNFFFRDERRKILRSLPDAGDEECDSGSDTETTNKDCVDDEGGDNGGEKSYELPSDDAIEKELKKIAEERRKIKMRVHKKTHGKIGFNELTKVISERWQNASHEVKSYYKKFALADAKRYAAEMKEYRTGYANSNKT
mmetsp:Transcript_12823/g.24064  ORF Transcript_12823/g.24064 Transcript_12823/m.24064 type:complete len:947 (-) Transcript_12823:3317-6157(-)|eukprot:CAMPEP_0176496652 /NCGR_PEP_ID=MMETSP0200_2-20121128/11305_1 /TAXON_ID=947934 /ORGANISM="Chaetoceros sp., Strain GSL56" /LENGTH=946 /DNA_ID=CAMNT_0017894613 /DNA_START=197 /DNA_END=3037 /DNA_ORIENTATION=+